MEIRVDERRRVLVSWDGRGPFAVLDPAGVVTEEFVPRGQEVWTDAEPDEGEGTYDDGYSDGLDAAVDAVRDLSPVGSVRRRRPLRVPPTTKPAARRPVTTVELPGGPA